MNGNYSVAPSYQLRNLCIKNGWFTGGANEQYEKLFYANEHGCPVDEIATIIWLCSDNVARRDVLYALMQEKSRYLSTAPVSYMEQEMGR